MSANNTLDTADVIDRDVDFTSSAACGQGGGTDALVPTQGKRDLGLGEQLAELGIDLGTSLLTVHDIEFVLHRIDLVLEVLFVNCTRLAFRTILEGIFRRVAEHLELTVLAVDTTANLRPT